jgi:hypothetical protein
MKLITNQCIEISKLLIPQEKTATLARDDSHILNERSITLAKCLSENIISASKKNETSYLLQVDDEEEADNVSNALSCLALSPHFFEKFEQFNNWKDNALLGIDKSNVRELLANNAFGILPIFDKSDVSLHLVANDPIKNKHIDTASSFDFFISFKQNSLRQRLLFTSLISAKFLQLVGDSKTNRRIAPHLGSNSNAPKGVFVGLDTNHRKVMEAAELVEVQGLTCHLSFNELKFGLQISMRLARKINSETLEELTVPVLFIEQEIEMTEHERLANSFTEKLILKNRKLGHPRHSIRHLNLYIDTRSSLGEMHEMEWSDANQIRNFLSDIEISKFIFREG